MEKQSSTNTNYNVPPLGAGTSTSSGVTVFNPSTVTTNTILPPTYDQAMGSNTAPFAAATTTRTYTTTNGWNIGGPGLAPTRQTTTTYTSYGTSVPQPPPPPRDPSRQTTFQQPPVVIIQQQPMVALGPEPVYLTCPGCHIQKLTRIEYEPSSRTHLMAALLCLVGLWCCVCLPYCAGSCMNTHHYCGNCGKFLGTYGNAL